MEKLEMSGRHDMLYHYHRGKSVAETTKIICDMYGKDSLTEDICQAWFKRFDDGNLYLKIDLSPEEWKMKTNDENKQSYKPQKSSLNILEKTLDPNDQIPLFQGLKINQEEPLKGFWFFKY